MRIVRSSVLALMLSAASAAMLAGAAQAQVSVDIRVNLAPPPLPYYEQPVIPAEGYIWVPGFWAWDDAEADYYWVPGTWVEPPQPELLWTPAYWGWVEGRYLFHPGYWGREVGFYGGIDYGFGYTGEGYWGGRWDNGHFFYNRSVNNVENVRITNVYNQTVVVNSRDQQCQLQWRQQGHRSEADAATGDHRPGASRRGDASAATAHRGCEQGSRALLQAKSRRASGGSNSAPRGFPGGRRLAWIARPVAASAKRCREVWSACEQADGG